MNTNNTLDIFIEGKISVKPVFKSCSIPTILPPVPISFPPEYFYNKAVRHLRQVVDELQSLNT